MPSAALPKMSCAAVLALAACATPPPPQAVLLYPTAACIANIMQTPEVRPIADKIVFGRYATVAMVSDTSRVTPEQQPAVQAAEARYSACIDIGESWRRQYMHPSVEAAGMRFVRASQASLALLYRGEISFGQYNTHFNASRADLEQRMADLSAANRNQQAQYQQQQALARIMAPPPSLPMVQFAPLPLRAPLVTTTCSRLGFQVTCQTASK